MRAVHIRPGPSAVMRHLVIVGEDLGRLIPLLIRLQSSFHVTTVAAVDDIATRALAASGQPSEMVVGLSGHEQLARVDELIRRRPRILFVTSDSTSALSTRIKDAGGLVLSEDEPSAVLVATLAAFSDRRHEVEST